MALGSQRDRSNGSWSDANEQIFSSLDLSAGNNLLSFTVPGGSLVAVAPPSSGELDVTTEGDEVVVRTGATELLRAPGNAIQRIDVSGTPGDDTVHLADLNAIFAGLVGGDAGAGHDTLRLTDSGHVMDLPAIADSVLKGFEEIDITGSGDNTLILDVNDVLSLSPTTSTLSIQHNDGDALNYGDGWTAAIPQIVGDQYVHVLKQAAAAIEVVNTLRYHNPLDPFDTNRDGVVSPVDALIVIIGCIDIGELRASPTRVGGNDRSRQANCVA